MTTYTKKELTAYLIWSLIVTVAAWSLGFSFFTLDARAASLTSVSDTLSNSNPGSGSNHVIAYTNATATTAGQTIAISIDPTTNLFGGFNNIMFSDITFTGATLVTSCVAGTDRVTVATSTAAPQITFTVCASNTVAAGSKTITIGNSRITNSTTTGSYVVRIDGTQANTADTRIAIVNNVTLTASVDTSLTFTISGVATGTTINGVTTTLGSTATALNFGTLPITSPVTLGQQLAVATNAKNGFAVTVVENQDPTSQTGATIHRFQNGNSTSTPSPWTAPTNTLNVSSTWGHLGVTSNDSDEGSGEFTSATFIGNFDAARQLFSATGTSDGTTQNIGLASVAYRIEIRSLQPAATDYTNVLTYVATPTF